MSDSPIPSETPASRFATTHWSVVRSITGDSPDAQAALESLCSAYWYPVYAYLRRLGRTPHDAEDLTQGFFAACLARRDFQAADPAKGRFRSFLLVALKAYLANQRDRECAGKRGGGIPPLPLDALDAERRYALEPPDLRSADRLFDRRWALTVLDRALQRLEHEQARAGKTRAFGILKDCLEGGRSDTPYRSLGHQLGLSEGAVKVAIHRLRKRFRDLLEEEIASTLAHPDDLESERRHLFEALAPTPPV